MSVIGVNWYQLLMLCGCVTSAVAYAAARMLIQSKVDDVTATPLSASEHLSLGEIGKIGRECAPHAAVGDFFLRVEGFFFSPLGTNAEILP